MVTVSARSAKSQMKWRGDLKITEYEFIENIPAEIRLRSDSRSDLQNRSDPFEFGGEWGFLLSFRLSWQKWPFLTQPAPIGGVFELIVASGGYQCQDPRFVNKWKIVLPTFSEDVAMRFLEEKLRALTESTFKRTMRNLEREIWYQDD